MFYAEGAGERWLDKEKGQRRKEKRGSKGRPLKVKRMECLQELFYAL